LAVFLADADARVRAAVRLLLEVSGSIRVIGEAADAASMTAGVERMRPDVLCLDWELPGLPEVRLGDIRPRWPALRVLVLSASEGCRNAALNQGADAFVSKLEPPAKVSCAVHRLLDRGPAHSGGRAG
jgi:two-component system invasion response regulator UvrY